MTINFIKQLFVKISHWHGKQQYLCHAKFWASFSVSIQSQNNWTTRRLEP